MYMMGKVDVIWSKIESYRKRGDVAADNKDPFLTWSKNASTEQLIEWENKFKKEMLSIYPDLRSYVRELEAIALCQSPMHQELAAAKEQIDSLKEQLKKAKAKKKAK